MKQGLIILLFLSYRACFSQSIPPFRQLRYDEDYSFLKEYSSHTWYHTLKFSSISKNNETFLSYGGDARFQYFYNKNELWGDAPEDDNGYVLARFLVHADLHAGKYFRTFVQMQSSLAASRINASPIDDNPLEFHQAFIDIKSNGANNTEFKGRFGRQEFMYGSQRLVSVREGPNNRLSFDAIKAIINHKNYRLDILYGHPVAVHNGIFNDGFNKNAKLWGTYLVWNKFPGLKNIDLYYLGLWKRDWMFDDGRGKELRHSIGARIWNSSANWKYDTEVLYQFGNFASKTIVAWTASVNTSYTFNQTRLKPEIGLKTELISGDKDYDDNKLQTFNPLFPRGAYFGLAALIGPANLLDLHPSLTLSLTKNLDISFDYDVFWRYSSQDGLYAVNAALIYSGKNSTHKYIGQQTAVNANYNVNNFLTFTVEFTWFDAGSFLKDVSAGKDILFAGFTAQLKF